VLIWSVERKRSMRAAPGGKQDITTLMRASIAEPLQSALANDRDRQVWSIPDDGSRCPSRATRAVLASTLARVRPGLVVTTSHGRSGPRGDLDTLRAVCGLPVDEDRNLLDPMLLTESWQPAGAIWYAHACCSAGTQSPSLFSGLFENTPLAGQFEALAKIGPMVAPLPKHLLGCPRPARAFIGHVEPTFDWTLRDPDTGACATWPLVKALYPNLFRDPVAYAFRDWYPRIGSLQTAYQLARLRLAQHQASPLELLSLQFQMADVQSTVILGDPAALLRS
jgi:hypothetical protein